MKYQRNWSFLRGRDVLQRRFPDARISCARFHASDKSEFIDRQEMDGLLDAVTDVPKFIARNTQLASRIVGMRRQDIPQYPAIAIREVRQHPGKNTPDWSKPFRTEIRLRRVDVWPSIAKAVELA